MLRGNGLRFNLGLGLGLAGGAPASALAIAKAGFREWIDPTIASTITGSPVATIRSPNAGGFVNPPNFQRSTNTGGDRPAITANRLVFNGTTHVLDGSAGYTYVGAATPADPFYAQAGKGPTTCGLARVSDGTWWLGHFGKKNELTAGGETFDGSAIHYNFDPVTLLPTTIIQEIRFAQAPISLAGVGIQGVTIDTTTGKLFCADPGNGKIYLINPTGPSLDATLTFAGANGIAFDSINDRLIVCVANSATMSYVNKTTGAVISTFTHRDLTGNALDMLFFDASYGSSGALYATGRDNLTNGRVLKYDLTTNTPVKAWSITEVQAIEAIVVVGNTFYFCSDEYYHNAAAAVNRVVTVSVDASSPAYGTRTILAGVAKIAATPAATVCLVHGGDSLSVAGGPLKSGVGLFFTTTPNLLRLTFRSASTQATIDWTVTTTTEFLYYIDINSATGDCTLYINGVIVSTQNSALVTGALPSLVWTMGASYENTAIAARFSATTQGGFIVTPDSAHQAEIEGYLSWQTQGSGALLQVGHTYKSVAPV